MMKPDHASTMEIYSTILIHQKAITRVTYSPCRVYLCSACNLFIHQITINSIIIIPLTHLYSINLNLFYTFESASDKSICIWNVKTNQMHKRIITHHGINDLDWSPCSNYITSCSDVPYSSHHVAFKLIKKGFCWVDPYFDA